jgi:hypothetical protein
MKHQAGARGAELHANYFKTMAAVRTLIEVINHSEFSFRKHNTSLPSIDNDAMQRTGKAKPAARL